MREVPQDVNELSRKVIGAFIEVSNTLGVGFLEKVYEKALVSELELRGIRAVAQAALKVVYKGEIVGDYVADVVVEDRLLVELKCVHEFVPQHVAQCLNYLKATGLPLCLLVNFQRARVQYQRIVPSFSP